MQGSAKYVMHNCLPEGDIALKPKCCLAVEPTVVSIGEMSASEGLLRGKGIFVPLIQGNFLMGYWVYSDPRHSIAGMWIHEGKQAGKEVRIWQMPLNLPPS